MKRFGLVAEHSQQLTQRCPEAREALERPELQHLVQQECGRLVAAARSGLIEKRERGVERLARRCGLRARRHPERRRLDDGAVETLGRCGRALDIDVLALRSAEPLAQAIEQLRPSGTEVAEHHRDARWSRIDRGEYSSLEGWAGRRHDSCVSDTGEKRIARTKGQKLRPRGGVVNLKIKNYLFDNSLL